MEEQKEYYDHILDIKEEVSSLRKEFNRHIERSNQQHLDFLLSQMEQRFSQGLMDYVMEDTQQHLSESMNPECKMRELCGSEFNKLLSEMSGLLGMENVREDTIETYRKRFDELKEIANKDKCDRCVKEASDIFEKEMKLIRSLKVHDKVDREEINIFELPEEDVVKDICEPLANKQRISILKALAGETKSFSQLSKLTKLRGGNLLFHLQKLLDTEMILQHDERGDYMITGKGYESLKDLSKMYSRLKSGI